MAINGHGFFLKPDANISGTGLLQEVNCFAGFLCELFPEMKNDEFKSVVNTMNNMTEKYSEHIVVAHESNPNEIYTIYTCYGKMRIGGHDMGPNSEKLVYLLENGY